MKIVSMMQNDMTMSSRDIAKHTKKRHDHVMSDIGRMLDELGAHAPDFTGAYNSEMLEIAPLPFETEKGKGKRVCVWRSVVRA